MAALGLLCVSLCLVVSDSSAIPWTVARQVPLSMGFSRQEYWSGLPCPPAGDLPDPGPRDRTRVSRHSCIAGRLFTTSSTWEAPSPSFFLSLKFTCSGHSGFYLESQLPSSFLCQVPGFLFLHPAYFREMTLI